MGIHQRPGGQILPEFVRPVEIEDCALFTGGKRAQRPTHSSPALLRE